MTVKTKMVMVMRRRTVWIMVLAEGWVLPHWQMRIGCDRLKEETSKRPRRTVH